MGRLQPAGGDTAWSEFHSKYGELIYRYARARGAPHDLAEDVMQEVEFQFFRASRTFQYDRKRGRFRSYLLKSAVSAMGRLARRARNGDRTLSLELSDHPESYDSDWDREWRYMRLRELLGAVLADQETATAEAFRRHVLAERPVAAVAHELGMSIWQVYRARDRVMARLRERLARGDQPLL